MDTRDGLHVAPVAQPETPTVDSLHPPDIGCSILGQRDGLRALETTWHARRPQQLPAQSSIRKLMEVAEKAQRFPGARERWRYEFEQRLGEIRRYVTIAECGTQADRVRGLRQATTIANTQRLLLNALETAGHYILPLAGESAEPIFKSLAHVALVFLLAHRICSRLARCFTTSRSMPRYARHRKIIERATNRSIYGYYEPRY